MAHTLLHIVVIDFLQLRGVHQWLDIMTEFPCQYWALSLAQDELGWDSLLARMVSTEFQSLQEEHLVVSAC